MRPRVALGRFLVRLGRFIESLAVVVMRPEDLVAFSRERYARPGSVDEWGQEFLHLFLSAEELRSEFATAGQTVLHFQSEEYGTWRGAVLPRPV